MSNYVSARVFQIIPLDADGNPDSTYEADRGYGYIAFDDDDEVVDYGLTLAEAKALISCERFLEEVAIGSDALAWNARHYGAVLFDVHYSPAELGVPADEDTEDPE